jgi:hypothetical protein
MFHLQLRDQCTIFKALRKLAQEFGVKAVLCYLELVQRFVILKTQYSAYISKHGIDVEPEVRYRVALLGSENLN